MLKKVVLPAPLGPMIETIDLGLIANDTSSTATRPPKIFETRCAQSKSAAAVRAALVACRLSAGRLVVHARAS